MIALRSYIALLLFFPGFVLASASMPLAHAPIDPQDHASLQRGARLYFNYCVGCHSLQFMRYNRLAQGVGIVDSKGRVAEAIVKKNFIFTGEKIGDTVNIALLKEEAKEWFGVAPPDLTVIERARGVDWLYTFLHSFYEDPKRPWGANNLLFPDVAMPNVLQPLQGRIVALQGADGTIKRLARIENGKMLPHEFDVAVTDVVNFLAYVSEPSRQERQRLGVWVLFFLAIWTVCLYLLKKEYWKKI